MIPRLVMKHALPIPDWMGTAIPTPPATCELLAQAVDGAWPCCSIELQRRACRRHATRTSLELPSAAPVASSGRTPHSRARVETHIARGTYIRLGVPLAFAIALRREAPRVRIWCASLCGRY